MGIDHGIHLMFPKINGFVCPNVNKLHKCPKESSLLHLCNSAKPLEYKTFPKAGSIQKIELMDKQPDKKVTL